MALTPTQVTLVKGAARTAVSGTFSAVAGDVIYALCTGDGTVSQTPTIAITDTTGGLITWTNKARSNTPNNAGGTSNLGGTAEIWEGKVTGTVTSKTVTATNSATTGGSDCTTIRLIKFTGAATTPTGATGSANLGATTAFTQALTTTAANSWIIGIAFNYTLGTNITANGNTAIIDNTTDSDGDGLYSWMDSSTTVQPSHGSGSSVTTGGTVASASSGHICAVEVLALSSGTNYTGSPVDPEGVTDAASAAQDNVRTQADAEAITDSATAAQDNVRSQADAEGIADAATASLGFLRTQVDTEAITDIAVANADNVRSQADAEGVTDAATSGLDAIRTQADAIGLTDAASAAVDSARTISDPVGIADVASVATDFARTVTDTVGLADAVAVVMGVVASPADTVGVADATSGVIDAARTQADPVGVADATVTQANNARTQADAIGLTDTASAVLTVTAAVDDAVGVADAVSVAQDFTRTQADMVGLVDNASAVQAGARTQADPIGLADAASVSTGFSRTQVDAEAITDAATAAQGNVRQVDDAVGLTDSVSAVIVGPITEYPGFLDAYFANLADSNDTSLKSAATEAYAFARSDVYAVGADLYCPVSAGTAVTMQLQSDSNADGIPDTVEVSVVSATIVSATKLQVRFATPFLMTAGKYYWWTVYCDTGQSFRYGFVHDEFSTGGPHRPTAPADYAFANIANVFFATSTETASGNGSFSTTLQFPNSNNSGIWLGISPVVGLVGSTSYSEAPSDPVDITDTASATQGLARQVTDATGVADSAVAVQDLARTAADPVGLTDSVSAAIASGVTRQVDDTVGASDAASAVQAAVRAQDDSIGLVDIAVATQTLARSQADAVGITDAASAVLSTSFTQYTGFDDSYFANLLDGNDTSLKSAATEAYAFTRTDVRALGADLYCPVSAGTAITLQLQSDSNADGLPDFVEASIVSGVVPSGTKFSVDFTTPVLMVPGKYYWWVVYCDTGQSFRYGFVAGEFATGGAHRPSAPADYQFIGITNVFFATSVETASGNGSFSTSSQFPATNNAGIWLGISPRVGVPPVGPVDYTGTPADAEGLTDSVAAAQDLVRAASDSVGISDSATAVLVNGVAYTGTPADTEGIADNAAAVQDLARTTADAVGLTDAVTAVLGGIDYVATIDDAIGVTDTAQDQVVVFTYTTADGVAIADTVSTARDLVREADDQVGIADSVSAILSSPDRSVGQFFIFFR